MAEPRVIPRAEHTLSRRDVDPDALKVLYRLRQFNHAAYLVGGSVRDLLIGRRPKDFDIGTSAHPYQVKKLFRNCWIIGRRFRLAHVKFGTKVIEVATFRRQVAARARRSCRMACRHRSIIRCRNLPKKASWSRRPGPEPAALRGGIGPRRENRRPSDPSRQHLRHARRRRVPARLHDQRAVLRHRDVLDHRLRRRAGRICAPAWCGRSAIRRSGSAKIRCG